MFHSGPPSGYAMMEILKRILRRNATDFVYKYSLFPQEIPRIFPNQGHPGEGLDDIPTNFWAGLAFRLPSGFVIITMLMTYVGSIVA